MKTPFLFYYRMKREILQAALHNVIALVGRQNILTFGAIFGIIKKKKLKNLNEDNKMILHKKKKAHSPLIFNTSEDLHEFIENEKPHCGITEEEKIVINKIGCSLNNAIRSGQELDYDTQRDKGLLQRLIQTHTLKESIIVNRAVRSIEYEMTLARNKGLSKRCLFHDGFVYTSLLNAYSGQIHLNILIPKGTPYLYTGIFSNTVGSYPSEENQTIEDTVGELILDIGTIFKIDRKRRHGGITIYDVHVDNTHSSVIK